MGSLRELLEKQKQEKLANVSKQSVLQSKAEQKVTAPPAETKPAERDIPAEIKLTGAAFGLEGVIFAKAGDITFPTNPVVEQRPPAGLTGLALIKWRREHANSIANSGTKASQTNSNANRAELPKDGPIGSVVEHGHGSVDNKSENKTADEQKKNDGTINVEELRRNLTYLANNIEQKELVGQIVRTIAVQLKQSPELTPLMSDADVDLVVRGLRRSYAIVARKKSEDREKRATKQKGGDELAMAFKEAGLDGLNLFK